MSEVISECDKHEWRQLMDYTNEGESSALLPAVRLRQRAEGGVCEDKLFYCIHCLVYTTRFEQERIT